MNRLYRLRECLKNAESFKLVSHWLFDRVNTSNEYLVVPIHYTPRLGPEG